MKIVIVGGGAGGLELATRLGNKLGRRQRAEITLIDRNPTHIWKPLLHEVASGTLDTDLDQVSYLAHASRHHFRFQLGTLIGLNRTDHNVILDALYDDSGQQVLPQRRVSYDYLVLSIGSISNDFGINGIAEHCIFLDSRQQAEAFHDRLLLAFLQLSNAADDQMLNIAIVGGGATGVELAAELHNAAEQFNSYGLSGRQQLQVTLIEAGERLLPALKERIAEAATEQLTHLGVTVRTATLVERADAQGLYTRAGDFIPAQLKVWAAGIKADSMLADLDGIECNRLNQLLVNRTLQTTVADTIFALGDCAACPDGQDGWIPPRAQAAHQQASLVAQNLLALLAGRPLKPFVYRDHGSLISLSRFDAVGNLMGNLVGGNMRIEGFLARMMYMSLYRMHQSALHGFMRMCLIAFVGRINRVIRPRLKLH